MRYHLTLKSGNKKTGAIPVSITSSDSCPPSCPFQGSGCYAELGPLAMHWKKVDSGTYGTDLDAFCESVAAFPDQQLWRHNQAGDLPGEGDTIDLAALQKLVQANQGKRGFTYTHKPLTPENRQAIQWANESGFRVNLSADNLEEADDFFELGVAPVCVVVPSNVTKSFRSPKGHKVIICPAAIRDDTSCASCKLCAKNRKSIVAFPAHGSRKKKVDELVQVM